MKEVYYYLNLNAQKAGDLSKDNRASDKRELLVNCAGSINTGIKHKSENNEGRLDYYLLYFTSGTMLFRSGKDNVQISSGDIIILPPGNGYTQEYRGGEEMNYLWLHFTGGGVDRALEELNIKTFPGVNKTREPNHLQTRFSRLFDCFLKNDSLRERDLSASLEKLLVEISRATDNYEKPKTSLSKSVSYINNSYTSQIKITELAKMEGMSMTRYNLRFKEQFGIPPTKYIINLRVNMAKELLCSSSLTLNQIGDTCGYGDYNFFAKVFKSAVGVSPKKYRQENR